jgi:mRNA interferase RelE/StbE
MSWDIEYIKEAESDLLKLDHSQRIHVLKSIKKVSENPLSKNDGGYGKPLGNRTSTKLSGYYKIKLLRLGIRVVYGLEIKNKMMKIIVRQRGRFFLPICL